MLLTSKYLFGPIVSLLMAGRRALTRASLGGRTTRHGTMIMLPDVAQPEPPATPGSDLGSYGNRALGVIAG